VDRIELRCDKRLHGVLTEGGLLDVSCRSALCGHRDGIVVIHSFDVDTGELIATKKYRDYPTVKEQGDALGHSTTVRNARHASDAVHD
jgi:hypothetical protein